MENQNQYQIKRRKPTKLQTRMFIYILIGFVAVMFLGAQFPTPTVEAMPDKYDKKLQRMDTKYNEQLKRSYVELHKLDKITLEILDYKLAKKPINENEVIRLETKRAKYLITQPIVYRQLKDGIDPSSFFLDEAY